MRPIVEKMNKILDQNAQIAEGIVTMADMVKEMKRAMEGKGMIEERPFPKMHIKEGLPPLGEARMPPLPPKKPLMPPPPKKKRTFGII
jgi:hypothetical protein